ncbi:MAG: enoyl-CoA hydratase-related protein, partial [Gordonia sp. (in: high G+C Gram-positive bacteria)]|uniref:enoyl-CoA hydratase-related protein n=1 Tax=Gordonia sp. (in: high G+C Gram-positive bacteria) TaxID=84139 RepID=UPI003BB5BAE3
MSVGAITVSTGEDGIVLLTIDDPTQRVNTMNENFVSSLDEVLATIAAQDVTGVIITSAKKTFFAGGDLNDLLEADPAQIDEFTAFVARNRDLLRRLETLPVPVVAAINGSALGGGLELALATHHRIVVDDPRLRLGLPEVTLGLLPGAGGVVRTVRLLGVQKALSELLLTGRSLTAAAARELGIVDHLVVSVDELIPAAREWIAANPSPRQPWDRADYVLPGGTPADRSGALNPVLPMLPARLRADLKGADYPAPQNILKAAVEGAQVDVDNALQIETRYFIDLALGQVAKNMIKANFFDRATVTGLRGRDADRTPWTAKKALVLGAGMMGAGIAYQCARAGIEVILKDVSQETAEHGKAYSARVLDKQVSAGRITETERDAVLHRIV